MIFSRVPAFTERQITVTTSVDLLKNLCTQHAPNAATWASIHPPVTRWRRAVVQKQTAGMHRDYRTKFLINIDDVS